MNAWHYPRLYAWTLFFPGPMIQPIWSITHAVCLGDQAVWMDGRFYQMGEQAVWTDDAFFLMDDPSSLNGCKLFLNM